MRCLPVASLLLCFWLVERSHCNGSLQESMGALHTRFALSLYQTLTETENNSNLIVSPVSVSLSLGLLQFGARGNTLAQLEGTLGYNVNGRLRLKGGRVFLEFARAAPHAVRAEVERWSVALSAAGARWCGAVLQLLLALQSSVVSGAVIPASTPTLISLTTPAAWPRGREVTVCHYKQRVIRPWCDLTHMMEVRDGGGWYWDLVKNRGWAWKTSQSCFGCNCFIHLCLSIKCQEIVNVPNTTREHVVLLRIISSVNVWSSSDYERLRSSN